MVLHSREQEDALFSTTNCPLRKAIASHFRTSRGVGRHIPTIKCSGKEVLETNQKQETKACIPKRIYMQRPRRQSDPYNAIPSENQVTNSRDRSKTMGHKRVRFQEQNLNNVVRVINTFSYEDLLCIVAGFFGKSSVFQLTAFLNRSARHLDYSTTTSMWQPRLMNSTSFTSNDAKRWRRLAHYDWNAEDEIYRQERQQPGSPIRAKVTNWLHRRRDSLVITAAFTSASKVSEFQDLSALVNIVNGCITVGSFQFDRRSILQLCNYQTQALGGFLTHANSV
uniref:AlNc14C390G11276 protein n=1 Tax=Albugo laibachii Nc14 TaxID=890382 RepID=F0WYL2_9STRA|nr:AlNc14C390G11276 [Albugo laibachii Nc14]CCA26877.1 AlNc14C426G11559 [Albugo laibachii Nc14]|eukprot:CCA26877.1 AlNc14C426G11559 [Albugo laibachii Nc14]